MLDSLLFMGVIFGIIKSTDLVRRFGVMVTLTINVRVCAYKKIKMFIFFYTEFSFAI